MARFRSKPGMVVRTTTAATTQPTSAISHSMGTNAAPIATSNPAAHAARLARCPGCRRIRPACRAISGSSTNTSADPKRPAATIPVAMGSSAYVTDAQTRTAGLAVTRLAASIADMPASGTQPISRTSTASQDLPASTVAKMASTARYGGADVDEPTPVGWNACR